VKIALLGFGTVGSSVARVLAAAKLPGLGLTHIFNRNVARKRASDAAKHVPRRWCGPRTSTSSCGPMWGLWWN
jgi:homoserine dehydrogenase